MRRSMTISLLAASAVLTTGSAFADGNTPVRDGLQNIGNRLEDSLRARGERRDNALNNAADRLAESRLVTTLREGGNDDGERPVLNNLQDRLGDARENLDERLDDARDNDDNRLSDLKDNLNDRLDTARDNLNDARDNQDNRLSNLSDNINDRIETARDNRGDRLSDVRDNVNDRLDTLGDKLARND